MRKLTLTLCLLLALLLIPSATAQDPEDFLPPFPPCEIDFKFLVETLADYDVEHQNKIAAGQYWGLTDLHHRVIYIDDTPDFTVRKLIVLHEMLHICYHGKGIDTAGGLGEHIVDLKARALYKTLFGE